jgi:hypothetical protein
VTLPDRAALDAVVARVRASGAAVEQRASGAALIADPSSNAILLTN